MKLAVTSFIGTAIICLVATTCVVDAFSPCHIAFANKAVTTATTSALFGSKVGIWYSSSTGNTETVASYIAKAAGCEKDFNDIGDAKIDEIEGADCLIVGAPTWHTGADEQRSGTSWDEWFVFFQDAYILPSGAVARVVSITNHVLVPRVLLPSGFMNDHGDVILLFVCR